MPYQNFDNVDPGFITFPNKTFLADINADGYPDIITNSFTQLLAYDAEPPSLIYLNNQDGTFLPLAGTSIYYGTDDLPDMESLAPIDFDKDGDIDLIGLKKVSYADSNASGNKGVEVILLENLAITWLEVFRIISGQVSDMKAGFDRDIDGDGKIGVEEVIHVLQSMSRIRET
jgi:hypothetical protein